MPSIGSISLTFKMGDPGDAKVEFENYDGHHWFRIGETPSVCLHLRPEHWDHFRSEMLMALRVADEHYAPLLGRKSEGDEAMGREAAEAYRQYHEGDTSDIALQGGGHGVLLSGL